jgi:hypothetical protein
MSIIRLKNDANTLCSYDLDEHKVLKITLRKDATLTGLKQLNHLNEIHIFNWRSDLYYDPCDVIPENENLTTLLMWGHFHPNLSTFKNCPNLKTLYIETWEYCPKGTLLVPHHSSPIDLYSLRQSHIETLFLHEMYPYRDLAGLICIKNLKYLTLEGGTKDTILYGMNVFKNLYNLTTLNICYSCENLQEVIDHIKYIPNLKILAIRFFYSIEAYNFSNMWECKTLEKLYVNRDCIDIISKYKSSDCNIKLLDYNEKYVGDDVSKQNS